MSYKRHDSPFDMEKIKFFVYNTNQGEDIMNYLNHKAYYSLNQALKQEFQKKVIKLSIDGGFTCPNRDGTIARGGCIFCTDKGSGEFTSKGASITEQMQNQILLLSKKWSDAKYIAYFQNFTNTYAPVQRLRSLYDEALSFPNVVGLAIATRPDCLSGEVLNLLEEYSQKTFLWIELGLQTIHEKTAVFLRRGYPLSTFEYAVEQLHRRKIRTVAHMIVNLPFETKADTLATAVYLSKQNLWGLKIHMLYLSSESDLSRYYRNHPFPIMEKDDYIDSVVTILCHISPSIVLHRLTGDGEKETLITPNWIKDKRSVLNGIDKKMRREKLYQGIYWQEER